MPMTDWCRRDTARQHALVILPTFNRARLLPSAIESVLLQDYPHKKLVIVDDGSTDDTRDVCRQYVKAQPEMVFYISKPNGGCASSRNVGLQSIDRETGYVCFLDSDDRFLSGKLSREVALLAQHPDADFSYSDTVIFEEETGREEVRKVAGARAPSRFAIEHFLTLEGKVSSILYRVEVFQGRRFREDFRYNEDSDFLQRVALECRGIYCNEPGSWVRSHPGSKSRNLLEINRAVLQSCREILESYPAFHREHAAAVDRRMERLRTLLFRELMEQGLYAEARAHASTAVETVIATLRLRHVCEPYWVWRSFLREPKKVRRAYWRAHALLRSAMSGRPRR